MAPLSGYSFPCLLLSFLGWLSPVFQRILWPNKWAPCGFRSNRPESQALWSGQPLSPPPGLSQPDHTVPQPFSSQGEHLCLRLAQLPVEGTMMASERRWTSQVDAVMMFSCKGRGRGASLLGVWCCLHDWLQGAGRWLKSRLMMKGEVGGREFPFMRCSMLRWDTGQNTSEWGRGSCPKNSSLEENFQAS